MLTQYLERSGSHCIALLVQAFLDTRQVIERSSECGIPWAQLAGAWILLAAGRHRTPR